MSLRSAVRILSFSVTEHRRRLNATRAVKSIPETVSALWLGRLFGAAASNCRPARELAIRLSRAPGADPSAHHIVEFLAGQRTRQEKEEKGSAIATRMVLPA